MQCMSDMQHMGQGMNEDTMSGWDFKGKRYCYGKTKQRERQEDWKKKKKVNEERERKRKKKVNEKREKEEKESK